MMNAAMEKNTMDIQADRLMESSFKFAANEMRRIFHKAGEHASAFGRDCLHIKDF